MLRRAIILVAAIATALGAQEQKAAAADIDDFLTGAAYALRDGPPAAFLALFDAKMAGFAQISKDVTRAMRGATVESQIAMASNEGSDDARNLQVDWTLRIETNDTASGVTTRAARVTAKVERRGGKWLFTSFAPADFFRPGVGTGPWDAIAAATSALRNGNPAGFLASCDRAMPGYEKLAQSITALAAMGRVESELDLTGLEGTDTERTVEVDWALNVSQGAFGGDTRSEGNLNVQRKEHVKVKLALAGKTWRITSIEPLSFFEPGAAKR